MKTYETIIYLIKEGVGYITLDRPEALNARNRLMRSELKEVYIDADNNPEVKVVIISGAGEKAFCTGLDLKEVKSEDSIVEARTVKFAVDNDTETLGRVQKPVIAAINGYAMGGGFELALACDIRIASMEAQFGLSEVKRGLIPGNGGTQRLVRLIGPGKAMELLLTGRTFKAEEACALGIVNKVVPKEELLKTAENLARTIASNAPIAIKYVKEAVYKGADLTLEQGLRLESDLAVLLRTTEDRLEGARAFAEKRSPNFKGR